MSQGAMQLDFRFSRGSGPRRRAEEDPFRILILGNFAGETALPLADRRPIEVDIDRFDRVLERFAPKLTLDFEGSPVALELRSLDDFHPDRLVERIAPLAALRQLRGELRDPASFRRAAAALGAVPAAAPEETTPESGDLERLLGDRPAGAVPAGAAGVLAPLLRELVAPHVVPDIADEQRMLVGALDATLSERMRDVLHAPAFQRLEALWRGLDRLVRELDLGESVRLFVLDRSRAEIAEDLRTHAADLSESQLFDVLCGPHTQAPDGKPWSLLVADLTVGADFEDLQLLATLAAMAGRAGAPILAAADPSLLGCSSVERLAEPRSWQPLAPEVAAFWTELRRSPLAPWIGLALPRVLTRLPYGKASDPISTFDFEEMAARAHSAYLWGNPALALALLAGRAFSDDGWQMELGAGLDMEDLPSHVYREDGEAQQQPCAEIAMGETAGAAVLDRGPMVLLSYRNRNAARLLRWQSIAEPATALRGAWAESG